MKNRFFSQKAGAALIILAGACGLLACNSESNNTAFLEVRLTDAPGDYEEVNIDIQDVEVNATDDANSGWKSIETNKGVYDILKLTGGVDALLGTAELPSGKISQIRLKLGDANSIKVNGGMKSLTTPSAQHSGLKLNIHENLEAGVVYKLLLDFDAARSIVATGSGQFNLKPVIRTIVEAQSGAIKGTISPIESTPAVYAISGLDTLATAFANQTTGAFLLRGLAPGTYQVTFEPGEGFSPVAEDNVTVTLGVVTDMGEISIPQ
ncbi:MAG TPA: DUF4382 domain-containing protein [Cyclobacteriaceae bacterium]